MWEILPSSATLEFIECVIAKVATNIFHTNDITQVQWSSYEDRFC